MSQWNWYDISVVGTFNPHSETKFHNNTMQQVNYSCIHFNLGLLDLQVYRKCVYLRVRVHVADLQHNMGFGGEILVPMLYVKLTFMQFWNP
jgi:hypothetical protein